MYEKTWLRLSPHLAPSTCTWNDLEKQKAENGCVDMMDMSDQKVSATQGAPWEGSPDAWGSGAPCGARRGSGEALHRSIHGPGPPRRILDPPHTARA